jgi:hypothetical protein
MNQDVYVMRLWHERSNDEQGSYEQGSNNQAWRVSITDTKSNQKVHFANLESLLRFFKEKLDIEDEVNP